jgi:macrolide transport system ATP-binding/permease protein
MALVELQGLGLSYHLQRHSGRRAERAESREVAVLKNVTLSIERGEMVAILGPSGSGKSTLLYILGCLLQPSTGSFKLANVEVTALTQEARAELRARTIGFVFQQFHLLPRANLIDNLLLSTRYNVAETADEGALKEKALALLASLGLQKHWHHRPNELSGGQQQRVAICRALMNDPELILADEPTGNLDSKSAAQVLQILRDIQVTGRTVVIVTHDAEVAKHCDRVITVHDGEVTAAAPPLAARVAKVFVPAPGAPTEGRKRRPSRWRADLQTSWQNLLRNKSRSFLTMLGVIIGVAAVLATLTLGTYTQDRILRSYESLGVNKVVIRAYPRWNISAKELKGPAFEGVSQTADIVPMRKLFPEIALVSPVVEDWIKSVEFGGKSMDDARILGVSEEYFAITNRNIFLGRPFSAYHVKTASSVCVIGYDIAKRLFDSLSPLGRVVQMAGNNDVAFSCLVLGVMAPQSSNSEWFKPNQQLLVPATFLSQEANRWNSKPHEFNVTVRPGASIADFADKVKHFFKLKYGRSVQVSVDTDSLLVGQMRTFLTLFTVLLGGVALISLAVGGIGIANMMLVSVTERFKEIGLRKALGARDQDILWQFLMESTILCFIAGVTGLVFGIIGYETILFFASKIFKQVTFEWVWNSLAMVLSLICIVAVGLLSGLVPALRAEKLQVVEALRSE